MKRYLLFLPIAIAVAVLAGLGAQCLGHMIYERTHPAPTAAVPDLRTIGSACTMEEPQYSFLHGKHAYEWFDAQRKECAEVVDDANLAGWSRTLVTDGEGHRAQFDNRADAVKWVESQPYAQGGAK